MEYIYAALLLHKAGKTVTEEHLTKVLSAAGTHVDAGKVKAVVAALEGANIEEIIAKASIVTAAPAVAAPTAEAKKEEKKPEEKKVSEEEAAAGLSSLFG
jgi:large subunit ribosomal protein L12